MTIVGVVQPAPYFPERMDALMNMVISEHHTSAMMVQGRTHRMTDMIARLAPGANVDQAKAEVAAIRGRVQNEFKEAYDPGSGYKVTLIPFQEVLGERARLTIWLLMAAAAFVMIISSANVANLTLMRGVRREHELVVRAALGARAGRLRKLLLIENLVLATVGAALGLVLANAGLKLLVTFAERYSARAGEIRLDGMVLGFTLLLTLAVALLLSYAPRLAQEGTLGTLLAGGATKMTGSLRKQRLQRALVVAQIAVSVVLLAGAGLLTRTMLQLSEVNTGLGSNTENVLTMEVPLFGGARNDGDIKTLYDRMRLEVGAIPGVKQVGLGSTIPLRSSQIQLEVKGERRNLASGEPIPRAEFRTANPDYFRASGVPLLRGRDFETTDRKGTAMVVILNKTLAEHLFPGQDAVGKRVAWTGDVLRFIGISGDWRLMFIARKISTTAATDPARIPRHLRPSRQAGDALPNAWSRAAGSGSDGEHSERAVTVPCRLLRSLVSPGGGSALGWAPPEHPPVRVHVFLQTSVQRGCLNCVVASGELKSVWPGHKAVSVHAGVRISEQRVARIRDKMARRDHVRGVGQDAVAEWTATSPIRNESH